MSPRRTRPPRRPAPPPATPSALLAELRTRCIAVWAEGSTVGWRCRSGLMTWSLLMAIKTNEAALAELIAGGGEVPM